MNDTANDPAAQKAATTPNSTANNPTPDVAEEPTGFNVTEAPQVAATTAALLKIAKANGCPNVPLTTNPADNVHFSAKLIPLSGGQRGVFVADIAADVIFFVEDRLLTGTFKRGHKNFWIFYGNMCHRRVTWVFTQWADGTCGLKSHTPVPPPGMRVGSMADYQECVSPACADDTPTGV